MSASTPTSASRAAAAANPPTVVDFRQSYPIAASAARVFAALTDSGQLRAWFAEHAEVEPRVGGRYAFWGNLTPWTPKSAATQRITALEPQRLLAYSWRWREFDGAVALRISPGDAQGDAVPGGDHCTLTVEHCGRGTLFPDASVDQFVVLDFWRVAVGNLRVWLRTGRAGLRPDYSSKGDVLELSIEIEAPASAVFRALSDPRQMDQWISTGAVVEPRVGGRYDHNWQIGEPKQHCGPLKLLAYEPDRLIEHDWEHKNEPPTRVRWQLDPLGPNRTRVTLTHWRFSEGEPERGGYWQGWAAFLLLLGEFAAAN